MPYKDPEKRRAYQNERNRRRGRGETVISPVSVRLPEGFRLQSAKDALQILERQVRAVLKDKKSSTVERARCIGYLVSISLKAIEAGDLASRVEALERLLNSRGAA